MAFTVASRATQNATDATSQDVVLVDGSNVSGRLVVICMGVDGTGGVTPPSGWTELFDVTSTDTTGAAFWRRIDGTEVDLNSNPFDGTNDTIRFTTASEQSNAVAVLVSAGHHGSVAPEKHEETVTTPDPGPLSPSWGSASSLFIVMSTSRFAGDYTAAPTNYGNLSSQNGGDSNAPLGVAWREANTGTEDPGVFTENGSNVIFVTATIAVPPDSLQFPKLYVVRSNLQLR